MKCNAPYKISDRTIFQRFKPDFDYLLPLRLPYFAPLRETKTVVHLPEICCKPQRAIAYP
ncbi:hypothetical protein H6F32_10875 [Anabaena sp. FACHB-1237]|uniref:hypothetical protein n=1 Tax=Anabaena sp. FACHB-1237 TaxID=2692769 RepID=UPI001680378F|nr:hypothetical protein [Anabaena sp. FACHB-1237]MBD2138080.1 hypothetical protein [Anabaena sp. FACHB-1237]